MDNDACDINVRFERIFTIEYGERKMNGKK